MCDDWNLHIIHANSSGVANLEFFYFFAKINLKASLQKFGWAPQKPKKTPRNQLPDYAYDRQVITSVLFWTSEWRDFHANAAFATLTVESVTCHRSVTSALDHHAGCLHLYDFKCPTCLKAATILQESGVLIQFYCLIFHSVKEPFRLIQYMYSYSHVIKLHMFLCK